MDQSADPLNVLLPNEHTMQSIGICHIQLPHVQHRLVAHIFPDTTLNTSLLSIAQLCHIGCTALFTSTAVTILYNQLTVLSGIKIPTTHLWSISFPEEFLRYDPPTANAVTALSTDAAFVQFTHAALGSPSISTLSAADICTHIPASLPRS